MSSRAVRLSLLLGSVGVSAAIGFGYAAFYALPALRSALAESRAWIPAAAHLFAALFFAAAQVVAGVRLLRGNRDFLAWLTPAALYLFTIGLVAWVRSDEIAALWLDSARGLILLGLGGWHFLALRQTDHG